MEDETSESLRGKSLWRETDGAERAISEEEKEREHLERVVMGLARCSVCEGAAKLCIFGLDGQGVWIGCDRGAECVRNIEYHREGWSVDEVAESWNHRNRGLNRVIRKIKRWMRERFGRLARREREMKREAERERKEVERKMMEVFGIAERGEGAMAAIKRFLFKGKRKQEKKHK